MKPLLKTTDAYRINLDTVTRYREALIAAGKIANESSILIVVGRQDTGDLEAQVRGSKHAWTVRMISADALAKLVALKENSELDSVGKIHELLIPFEYTKLDRIIEIAFTVAEEATAALKEEQASDSDALLSEQEAEVRQHHTSPEVISDLRSSIIESLTSAYVPLCDCTPNMKSSGSKAAPVRTPARQRLLSRLISLSISRIFGGTVAACASAPESEVFASSTVTLLLHQLPVCD